MILFTGISEKMFLPQILFISVGVGFGVCVRLSQLPTIKYVDLGKPKIFNASLTDYEQQLYNAFEAVENSRRKTVVRVASAVPVLGAAAPIFDQFYGWLNPGSEWRIVAATMIDVNERQRLDKDIEDIKIDLGAIRDSLTPRSSGPRPFRSDVIWNTHYRFDEILNHFTAHESLLKKYPLVGSPLLIELAHFVASLSTDINDYDLACKMRNILLEYRQRAVDARFDKIASNWTAPGVWFEKNYEIPLLRSNIFYQPYNKAGYMEAYAGI